MTILVTTAQNDADLVHALGSMALPLPIAAGDACFDGVGYGNKPILIVCERKHTGDLAQCILNGRYQHQLQIAKENGADVLVLILESSQLRPNPEDGVLEQLNWGISPRSGKRCQVWEPVRPTISYSHFDQFLTEVQYLTGVIYKRTFDVQETALVIKSLWLNFQKAPDDHNSLHNIYKSPVQGTLLMKPSLVRRVASEMPGIGWEWSKVAAEKFPTVKDLVSATVEDWAELEHRDNGKSRRLGMKAAEKIIIAINKNIS